MKIKNVRVLNIVEFTDVHADLHEIFTQSKSIFT